MKKVISTQNAPAAIGPYSQAIEWNGIYFRCDPGKSCNRRDPGRCRSTDQTGNDESF